MSPAAAAVVVAGAGPGGLAAARWLIERGGDRVRVTLVAPDARATMLAGTLDVAVGAAAPDHYETSVAVPGVACVAGAVAGIAAGAGGEAGAGGLRATLADGTVLAADAVIAAPGLALDADAVPAWPHVRVAWDPRGAEGAAETLLGIERGRILVAALGTPYRCPPAPFGLAIRLADHHFRARHMTRVVVATPEPMPLAGVGGDAPAFLMEACAAAGVEVERGFTADLAASEDGVLRASGGREIRYDAAFLVPPHRRATCLDGLPGEGPLVDPAQGLLRVVGDAAATGLPRAAGIARAQGAAAADAVLVDLGLAAAAPVPELAASCYLPHSGGGLSRIVVTFPDGPPPAGRPRVRIDGPSLDLVHALEGERTRFLAAAHAPA